MARSPYFRKALRAWYVLHNGRQVRLGRTRREANAAWRRLLLGQQEPEAATVAVVESLVRQFLGWCVENRAAATVTFYRKYLNPFANTFGHLPAAELRPLHVSEWLTRRRYKGTTANCALRAICRCFNWCARQGLHKPNPLIGIERPAATPREVYISAEQWASVLAHVPAGDPFRDLLILLWETGCRPQEARTAESRHFSPGTRTLTFPRAESKGRRRQRVVVLNDAAAAIVERLANKHPQGPLFRNTDDRPWTPYAMNCRFTRLKAKVGVKLFAYAIRHTWATNALLAGVEPLTVATLMGHASINMVWSTYQKLQLQSDHMRRAAEQATRPRTQPPPSAPQALPPVRETAQPKDEPMIAELETQRIDYDAKAEETIMSLSETPEVWGLPNLIPKLIDGTANPLDIVDKDRLRLLGSFAFVGVKLRADMRKKEEARILRKNAKAKRA